MAEQPPILQNDSLHQLLRHEQLTAEQALVILRKYYPDIEQQLRSMAVNEFYDFCYDIGVSQSELFTIIAQQ